MQLGNPFILGSKGQGHEAQKQCVGFALLLLLDSSCSEIFCRIAITFECGIAVRRRYGIDYVTFRSNCTALIGGAGDGSIRSK